MHNMNKKIADVTGTTICIPKCTDRDMRSKLHSQKYAFQNAQYE